MMLSVNRQLLKKMFVAIFYVLLLIAGWVFALTMISNNQRTTAASEIGYLIEQECAMAITVDPNRISMDDVPYYRVSTESRIATFFMNGNEWECHCE